MKVERRKNPRYRMHNREIVVIEHDTDILAFVRDAGPGGMQIQYTPPNVRMAIWQQIDIIGRDSGQILISDVRCQTTYNIQGLVEEGSFSGDNIRFCGLAFGELSPLQQSLLHQLIARSAASEQRYM